MSVSKAKHNDETQKNGGVCQVCGSTDFIEKNGIKICAFCGAFAEQNGVSAEQKGVGDANGMFFPSCPFCGGTDFDTDEDVLICRHCGESYFIEDLKQGARRSVGVGQARDTKESNGTKESVDEKDDNGAESKDLFRSARIGNASESAKPKFYAPPESLAEKIKNDKRERENERSVEQSRRGNGKNGDGVIRKLRDGQNESVQKENGESLTLGFLDAVSRLNEKAYDLVDGNANVWARTAYAKNIIGREDKSEVGRIVAKRNRIAHGFGGKVRASREDVDGAKKYYDVMIKTRNKIV